MLLQWLFSKMAEFFWHSVLSTRTLEPAVYDLCIFFTVAPNFSLLERPSSGQLSSVEGIADMQRAACSPSL